MVSVLKVVCDLISRGWAGSEFQTVACCLGKCSIVRVGSLFFE